MLGLIFRDELTCRDEVRVVVGNVLRWQRVYSSLQERLTRFQ
jgi:hypothetical protein